MTMAYAGAAWSAPLSGRPILTLPELEAFDPHAPVRGAKRRFCCPFPGCGDAKRVDAAHRSLELETATGAWRCYRCKAWGRLWEHWQPHAMVRRAAVRRAYALTGASLTPLPSTTGMPHRGPERAENQSGVPERYLAPCSQNAEKAKVQRAESQTGEEAMHWCEQLADARPVAGTSGTRYLAQRGIPEEMATVVGVLMAPCFYGRPAVLFPLRDRAGELVGVNGRYLDRGKPKARTAGRVSLGVFATQGAFAADPLIVAEAPIDALSLAVCGFPAIALGGTSYPDWFPVAAARRWVVLALDADAGGDAGVARLSPALQSLGARVERWRPTAGKDWNELLMRNAGALRSALFSSVAGYQYQEAREHMAAICGQAPPAHAALEAAIDACDYAAFSQELAAWVLIRI